MCIGTLTHTHRGSRILPLLPYTVIQREKNDQDLGGACGTHGSEDGMHVGFPWESLGRPTCKWEGNTEMDLT
jgi:hypothetical protein